MKNTNSIIWDTIYKNGLSNLTYPNEVFVRIINRIDNPLKNKKDIKVLDFGFGSGNNLIHLANLGYDVYGIEVSEHAKSMTLGKDSSANGGGGVLDSSKLFVIEGNEQLEQVVLGNQFDIIVAWQVIYYNSYADFQAVLKMFYKLLKTDGMIICTMIRKNDFAVKTSIPLSRNEFLISDYIGNQENSQITLLETESEIIREFSDFEIFEIGYFENLVNKNLSSHWTIYGRKK